MIGFLKKGGVATLDQILYSGSNFLINIFLAKILSQSDYGLFGILYSIYLLITIFLFAVFLDPYMYYVNALKDKTRYIFLNSGFANFIVAVSLIVFVISFLLHSYIGIFFCYIIITYSIYFYKRHFFAMLTLNQSLIISVFYCITTIIGLALLTFCLEKNLFNAILILYTTSAATALIVLSMYKIFRVSLNRATFLEFIETLKKQRKFAMHCLSSSMLAWLPANIYFLIIPIFISTVANGQFKALQNFNLPLFHINIAISSLLVPLFMRSKEVSKLIKSISTAFIVGTILYLVMILLFKPFVEEHVYNNKYHFEYLILIPFIVAIIPEVISNTFKAYFRSIGKPELIAKINFKNTIFCLIGLVFVPTLGIPGVIISYALVNLFNLLNCYLAYKKEVNSSLVVIPQV